MKLKEIISQVSWMDVAIALVTEHPDQRKSVEEYKAVFESLLTMEPRESDYQIQIERVADILDSRYTYPDVFGVKVGDDKSWSIALSPWAEWIGMDISQKTFDEFSDCQIVANCLYEMTFFGFTEDMVMKKEQDLEESVEKAKAHPEKMSEINPEDLHVEISMKGYLKCLDRWIKWGSLSREFFGEDLSWFRNRFLNIKAPESYDELDRQTLKAALREIVREIDDIATHL